LCTLTASPQGGLTTEVGHVTTAKVGETGIRTPGTLTGSVVFKTTAIDHSAIPPRRESGQKSGNFGVRYFGTERQPVALVFWPNRAICASIRTF
jgi:hypothetical protein